MTGTEPREDDPKAPMTIVITVVGALLVFVIVIALQAFFYNSEEAERGRKVYSEAPEELARLRAQQLEGLRSYRWIDSQKGVVAIPVQRAMELIVREQGGPTGVGPALSGTPRRRP